MEQIIITEKKAEKIASKYKKSIGDIEEMEFLSYTSEPTKVKIVINNKELILDDVKEEYLAPWTGCDYPSHQELIIGKVNGKEALLLSIRLLEVPDEYQEYIIGWGFNVKKEYLHNETLWDLNNNGEWQGSYLSFK